MFIGNELNKTLTCPKPYSFNLLFCGIDHYAYNLDCML